MLLVRLVGWLGGPVREKSRKNRNFRKVAKWLGGQGMHGNGVGVMFQAFFGPVWLDVGAFWVAWWVLQVSGCTLACRPGGWLGGPVREKSRKNQNFRKVAKWLGGGRGCMEMVWE